MRLSFSVLGMEGVFQRNPVCSSGKRPAPGLPKSQTLDDIMADLDARTEEVFSLKSALQVERTAREQWQEKAAMYLADGPFAASGAAGSLLLPIHHLPTQ